MIKTKNAAAGLVAALLFGISIQPAAGQNATITDDDPRLDPKRIQFLDEERQMSIAEVIQEAFSQNLDLRISRVEVQQAREDRIGASGIYDPTLNARAARTKVESESANTGTSTGTSSFGGSGTTNNSTFDTVTTSDEASVSIDQLIPTGALFSVGYGYQETDLESDSVFNSFNPTYNQRVFARVTQPLLKNFGPTVTNLEIRTRQFQLEAARYGYKQTLENQIAAVMNAYWDLVFSVGNLEVQRTSLKAALELERVNKVRVDNGVAPLSDYYQAQAQVAQRENQVILAKSQIFSNQDRLLALMNWASDEPKKWDYRVVPTDEPSNYDLEKEYNDEEVIVDALNNRPQLKAVEMALKVAETTRDANWWQRFPELNLFAEYAYAGFDDNSSGAWDDVEDRDYAGYNVGIEFKYPLLNRRAKATYRRSEKEVQRQLLNTESAELLVMTEVRAATRLIRTAQESIEASEAQVRAAQETLNSEQKRLEVGSSTTFQVLDFQEDLATAQVNELQAQVGYQQGVIELARSEGMLLPMIMENLGIILELDPNEE